MQPVFLIAMLIQQRIPGLITRNKVIIHFGQLSDYENPPQEKRLGENRSVLKSNVIERGIYKLSVGLL